MHRKLFEKLSTQIGNSFRTILLVDVEEQRKIYVELQTKWESLSKTMKELQNKVTTYFVDSKIPPQQKLASIETELEDLCSLFGELKEPIDNEERFQLHLNRVQVSIIKNIHLLIYRNISFMCYFHR